MDPYSDPQFAPANRSGSRQPVAFPDGFWSADLRVGARRKIAWLWHDYLAAGSITLWTSRWKAGKTTLLSVLLARRVAGGELAGRAVAPGRTALVSEESRELWELRRERLDFGNHTWFQCHPFSGRPSLPQWSGLIDRLAKLKDASGVDLVAIDSLSHFLPGGTENLASPDAGDACPAAAADRAAHGGVALAPSEEGGRGRGRGGAR
jgi:hypothetical protein